jgi:hypothetical protein
MPTEKMELHRREDERERIAGKRKRQRERETFSAFVILPELTESSSTTRLPAPIALRSSSTSSLNFSNRYLKVG